MIGGFGVIVLILLVGVLAGGLVPARPALTMVFAGLTVVSGGVLVLAVDDLIGTVAIAFGLVLGAVALWRDAGNR